MPGERPGPDAAAPTDRQADVDELRQRLRALGYLDAGVDRFVLGPARGRRGAVAIAFLASLRIGVLGALLLTPAAALAIASGLPGLVTSLRDRVVIALYIAVLFGVAISAVALVCGLLVALAARRGRSIARHARAISVFAGVMIAGACLVYLTLLWSAAQAAGQGHGLVVTGAALAIAACISLLLGHAVMLSTLALVVAATGSPIEVRGVPGASWRVMLGAGLMACAGALVVAHVGAQRASAPRPAPRLTVVPSGLRLRVVAIDGFDQVLFETLSAAGRVPALTLAVKGASARLVLNDRDAPDEQRIDPARLWTTIATAQPAAVHGVHALETRRLAGVEGALEASPDSGIGSLVRTSTDLLRLTRPAVASGSQRREKTFWEVAADAGLRTTVVNWWATWPALADNGIVLSDRATLRLEHGGALDGEISPPALYPRLSAEWVALRDRASSLAAEALKQAPVENEFAANLRRSALLDALALVLAREVSDAVTDLSVVYLPGLDIAQHVLLAGTDAASPSPSTLAARLTALEAYYIALDTLLAETLRPGAGEMVMMITAPGRVAPLAAGRLSVSGSTAAGSALVEARATDVAPTILHALGLPISEALAGSPILGLFDPPFLQRYGVRRVPTYGPREAARVVSAGRPLDQEMVDRLRSLGYVR